MICERCKRISGKSDDFEMWRVYPEGRVFCWECSKDPEIDRELNPTHGYCAWGHAVMVEGEGLRGKILESVGIAGSKRKPARPGLLRRLFA